jgi:hypothetical protein
MERRLREPALAKVMRALARQQALAQDSFGALQRAALGEGPIAPDEDVLDGVRMRKEGDPARPDTEADGVAVLPDQRGKKLERPALERAQVPEVEGVRPGSWQRAAISGSGHGDRRDKRADLF